MGRGIQMTLFSNEKIAKKKKVSQFKPYELFLDMCKNTFFFFTNTSILKLLLVHQRKNFIGPFS